ncbi:MAG: DNA gyrase subunit A [Oscillospiraceae bacterium]|jgi:DNA gyrase subunit A|nr:DNA gyrase subunit A [Oscillospiraceae bacterium]
MQEFNERIVQVDIEDEMKKSFLEYSMSVIVSRALPDVRDGLKPVHRRILYTMHENGLTPDKAYRKCADTVGSVLGRYHPHGDASVYDALVRLAQDFSLRYPLVDGHGNFGSVDGDPPAAYRYTEAKMSKIATAMLTDIDKETIDYASNYDDRLEEPKVLPSRFPNLLVNGSMGIAVGMTTNIPPHNLGEVIDAVNLIIENPEATLDDLMTCIKGPDFPTGGIIMGRQGIRSAYATGRGKITVRGRAEIREDEKSGRMRIVVSELPYMVNKARLIEHIAELVKEKRIDSISNLADHSDRDGMEIVIDLKRDANAQVALNQLYSFTQLQSTEGVIMIALHDRSPKVMSLKEMLTHYVNFQCEIIERRTRYELKKAEERAHILEGLVIAQDNIDEVVNIFRTSKTPAEAKDRLMERFGLSEEQANAIAQMTMSRLTGLERQKLLDELLELKGKIAEYNEILSDHERVLGIIKDELAELRRKYADGRRTEIQMVSGEVDVEDLIPVEDRVITLTHYGYLKAQELGAYKTQRRGGRGISGMQQREEDFVEELFIASTHDYIMFFTNLGRCYRLKTYEIGQSGRAAKGTNIVNLLSLTSGEHVAAMIRMSRFDEDSYLVMLTRNGVIKRTHLSQFRNVRSSGLIAINLDDGDMLCGVRLTDGRSQLVAATRMGMAIRFHEEDARSLSRGARGVKAISLAPGDQVVDFEVILPDEEKQLLTVSVEGKGRRTDISEFRLQSRGGKGIQVYRQAEVAGVKIVSEEDEVFLISDDGIIIRIAAADIAVQSRYGSGVRVMRLSDGHRVVTLAKGPHSDEDEETGEDHEETGGAADEDEKGGE